MKNNLILIAIVALVIGIVGGFFGGIQYQKMQRGNFLVGQSNVARNGQQGGNFQGRFGSAVNRPVIGQIVSADDTGVTIKTSDGSTKIVIVSDKTLINKASTGTKADLKTGEKIAAFGTSNSDGSVTAQSIQLNPQMRIGGASK